jgi:hypothetical protein
LDAGAAWDVQSSRYITQLCKLNTNSEMLQQEQSRHPEGMQQLLNCGGSFHWRANPVPPCSSFTVNTSKTPYGIAGPAWLRSVDERTEAMGAGYVLGADTEPIISFSARVGGPLASARAEAASLLQLLQDVWQRFGSQVHLLIFVDCLVILDILRKWGRNDFHPNPKEIVHFAVIRPLLHELRQWSGKSQKPHRLPSQLTGR